VASDRDSPQIQRMCTVRITSATAMSMMNKRSSSFPKSSAKAVDDAEHCGESGANASFQIVGIGAFAGGLNCERLSR
jgi:hypothetical protein